MGRASLPDVVNNVWDFRSGDLDDTEPIRRAMNASSSNGNKVVFPGGVYNISEPILAPDNVCLEGWGRVTIRATADMWTMFYLPERSNIFINNLIFDANNMSSVGSVVNINGGYGHTLKDCFIGGLVKSSAGCVWVKGGASQLSILQSSFYNAERGVALFDNSNRIDVKGCLFYNLLDAGIYGVGSGAGLLSDVSVVGNRFWSIAGGFPRQPIYFTADPGLFLDRMIVAHNEVEGEGIPFADGGNGDAIAAYNFRDSSVVGNTVRGGGDVGIALWNAERSTVTANTVQGCASYGVTIMDSSQCTVSSNVISGSGMGGISVYQKDTVAEDNVVVGNVADGIIEIGSPSGSVFASNLDSGLP